MKAVAVIALILAIVLGVTSVGKYFQHSAKSNHYFKLMLAAGVNSPKRDYYRQKRNEYDAKARTDLIVTLVAITFLIGSRVMFSKAKSSH